MNNNLEMILHGVGTSQLVFTDGTFLPITESQDIEISVEATEAEVEGGDGFFALLTYITKKTGKITITDAVMSLPQIKATTGSEVLTSAEVMISSDVKTVATGAAQLTKTTNVIPETVVAKLVAEGTPLTRIATGTPTAGQFKVTSAGVVTVDTTLNSKEIEFSYYYSDATGISLNMLETEVPKNCELRHQIVTDEMPDGKRYQLDIRVYRCKAKGSYSYTAKKGGAFAPKIEFSILNAGRSDKRTLSYNVSEYVG